MDEENDEYLCIKCGTKTVHIGDEVFVLTEEQIKLVKQYAQLVIEQEVL